MPSCSKLSMVRVSVGCDGAASNSDAHTVIAKLAIIAKRLKRRKSIGFSNSATVSASAAAIVSRADSLFNSEWI